MAMENPKFEVFQTADSISFVFSSSFRNIDRVCDRVGLFLRSRVNNISKQLFSVDLIIREGLSNAVRHGNAGDPEKTIHFLLVVENRKRINLVIEDQGKGFDWKKQQLLPAQDSEEHGRGVFIMQTYSTRCRYNEKGNILYLEKDISNG